MAARNIKTPVKTSAKMSDTLFHKSSGNVFTDMGIPTHEAAFLRVRAQLMVELIRVIRSRKLSQVAAGKLFAISQPRVSDILRGKIDRFSIDALVDMLALAGLQVQVTTKAFHKVA